MPIKPLITAHHHNMIFLDIKIPGRVVLDAIRVIKSRDRENVVCRATRYDQQQEYRDAGIDSADRCRVD